MLNSDKMIINGVDMNIRFTRAPNAFLSLAPSDDNNVRFNNLDATLFNTQVEL